MLRDGDTMRLFLLSTVFMFATLAPFIPVQAQEEGGAYSYQGRNSYRGLNSYQKQVHPGNVQTITRPPSTQPSQGAYSYKGLNSYNKQVRPKGSQAITPPPVYTSKPTGKVDNDIVIPQDCYNKILGIDCISRVF